MLIVVVLGSAAGGGFPQWNCRCRVCEVARAEPHRAWPRTQSGVAISADGRRWTLLNASPDIARQLERLPLPDSTEGSRVRPFDSIVLTDAELDHTLGLPLLRQAGNMQVYCTLAVRDVIAGRSGLLDLVRPFSDVGVHLLSLDTPVEPVTGAGAPAGFSIEAFAVAGHPPRFVHGTQAPGLVIGLLVTDNDSRRTLAYVPSCGAIDEKLRARLASADAVLFDGTFWYDHEMHPVVPGARTAREMGHVPVDGPDGSLAMLRALPASHRLYVHINNTNPMLVEDSAERRVVQDAGVVVGYDGLQIILT